MIATPLYVRLVIVGYDGEPVRSWTLRQDLIGALRGELQRDPGVMVETPDTSRGPLAQLVDADHSVLLVTVPIADHQEAREYCWELVWYSAAACDVRIQDVDVTDDAATFLRAS